MRLAARTPLVVVALALGGCLGGEDEKPRPRPVVVTAEQVRERFERLTGDVLEVNREFSDPGETILDPVADFTERYALYGGYDFTVYRDARTARRQAALDIGGPDRPIRPTREGIYWDRYPGSDNWEARRVFANFVLAWDGSEEKRTDERFDRLVRIAEAIGARPGTAAAELPPEDRPCEQVGIDPASGKEGTCKLGGQTLVVVNRGTRLETPGVFARIERLESGEQIDVRGHSEPLARARGTFVFARVRMTNRTREEIQSPFVELAVGGRRFKDSGVGFQFKNDFPLGPGDTGAITFVFDVPKRLRRRALSEGGLLLPGDTEQFVTVPDATVVGRLRLSR